jgi:hypothetical protein
MKMNKIVGVLLLVLTAGTVVGMGLNSDAYWSVYNYATLVISALGAIVLLKQK